MASRRKVCTHNPSWRSRHIYRQIVAFVVTIVSLVDAVASDTSHDSGIVTDAASYVVDQFVTPVSNGSFQRMVVNEETQNVYIGAVDYIYGLDQNLDIRSQDKTGPLWMDIMCQNFPSVTAPCRTHFNFTNDYTKILLIDYMNKRLVTCGTNYHGVCYKRDLNNVSITIDPVTDPEAVVGNQNASSAVAFIAPGPSPKSGEVQPNALYVAASWYPSWSFISGTSTRSLDDFALVYSDPLLKSSRFIMGRQNVKAFPIHYLYGFSSGGFSYFLQRQMKTTTANKDVITVISRVCQNDKRYHSYMELALSCRTNFTDEKTEYPLITAARLGHAGRNLAIALGVSLRSDVLFTVFSKAHADNSRKHVPTGESVMCVFSMDKIKERYTDLLKACFDGRGTYGGGHLGLSRSCVKNQEYAIDDTYCGESDSNYPIQGSEPYVSQSVLTFPVRQPSPLITAIQVDITHEYTVAFVGTSDGRLMKVSVDLNASSNIYETVSVTPGKPIRQDLFLDETNQHLYVLSEKKLLKLKKQDCSKHATCSECLNAGDPYCGWCSLDFKCSPRSECHASDLPQRWLPYTSQNCPQIRRIQPELIQRDKERLLTVDIKNLPDFQQSAVFQCHFSQIINGSNGNAVTVAPYANEATKTGDNFQCYSPPKAKLPPFEDGQDSVDMRLSLRVNDDELVSQDVAFFDCGVHTTCTACTRVTKACSWCIRNHLCTDNPDKHCNTDDSILGSNTPSSSRSLRGPKECPRFMNLEKDNQILVGAGTNKAVRVRALAMKQYQMADLRCQFITDQDVEEVPAKLESNTPTGETYITCQKFIFSYIRDTKLQKVPFKVLWGGAENALDNPEDVYVMIYKCSEMASTCGDCFTIDPRYECGWCDNTRCSTIDFCTGTVGGFLVKGAVCKDAEITEFYPKSGPLKGGTMITIHGKNLGASKDDVEVFIDMFRCDVESFKAPNKIVCKTKPASRPHSWPVLVVVGKNSKNNVMAESEKHFSFVQPKVTAISPDQGVHAGGTIVTMTGEHLDAGSDRSVYIGKIPCTDVKSINATALTFKTVAAVANQGPLKVTLNVDSQDGLTAPGLVFRYVSNPNITWLSRYDVIQSGGLNINISGEYLRNVQNPKMLLWYQDVPYAGTCELSKTHPSTNMTCQSPNITAIQPQDFKYTGGIKSGSEAAYLDVEFGFLMDAVEPLQKISHLGKMRVYPDPMVAPFSDGSKSYQPGQGLLILKAQNLEAVKNADVRVEIGQGSCEVQSVAGDIICKPPATEPAALEGNGFPEVVVHVGQTKYELGTLQYDRPEELSEEAIIGIAVGVVVILLIFVITCIICLIKFRRNDDMMKKMKKEMDQLESRVANECKDAFAELQTDMNELQSDLSGGGSIPFWDYRTYCMRVLFPPDCNDHPVIRELELDYHHREDTKRGLKRLFDLIRNKTFLLIFIRTLESNNDFHLRDRVNVASLISVTLQTHMDYSTEILKTLLAELIEKTVENPKQHAKLLLRRNESVAEKMLTNWFTFLLYKFLKECAGQPLFFLYGAIKQQVSKGPVDAVTGEARYSLSEDKLLRQHINYRPLTLHVMDVDVDRCPQPTHPVKVLDCDTISQVKEKILDTIYKSAPFSSRPPKEELDLVLFDHPAELRIDERKTDLPLKMFPNKETKRLILSDEDHTTKSEGDCKRLNTLSHYKVPDGAYVALHPKQTSMYNMSFMSEKSKYSDNSYYNQSPLLNRSTSPKSVNIDVDGCKVYHLVRHQDVDSNSKEGERGNKMVSEIYLPRLLVTKGTLETFVDDLFERIFSTTHRSTVMPLAIKYMFDFLDDQAMLHNMPDDVVHTWKSNSLPLRFWVNVIKNPNFAFDIYKSNIVDACLTVIGQTFMDCCSTLEHKLTKESPSGKLLYNKDIPKYKQWVASYYQNIKIMPAISDQDMLAMLAEESRAHQNEFNTNAALLELWKYVKKYYEDIVSALEDDEFAKKFKLTSKLDEVSNDLDGSMDGSAIC